jgi:hypothetical protein
VGTRNNRQRICWPTWKLVYIVISDITSKESWVIHTFKYKSTPSTDFYEQSPHDHKGLLSSIWYITEFKPHEILWTWSSNITVNKENKEKKHFSVVQKALPTPNVLFLTIYRLSRKRNVDAIYKWFYYDTRSMITKCFHNVPTQTIYMKHGHASTHIWLHWNMSVSILLSVSTCRCPCLVSVLHSQLFQQK